MTRRTKRPVLTPDVLIQAYRSGFFPMAENRTGPIFWYSPDPRAVIPLSDFHISRSLRQTLRKGEFELRVDTAFEATMRACADRDDTWISDEIIEVYVALFERGYGHSIEAWQGAHLQGGLYGVALGGAFFGESMFSLVRDASKVALVALVERLISRRYSLLDIQFLTPHLLRFGAMEISRDEYLSFLTSALREETSFSGDPKHRI